MIFEIDRTFSYHNPDTGLMDWFFYARDGVYGPYRSKEQATEDLKEFISYCIEVGDDGGRTEPKQARLSIMPQGDSVVGKHFYPLKKKKGIESL